MEITQGSRPQNLNEWENGIDATAMGIEDEEVDDMAEHLNQFWELANHLWGLSNYGKGMEDSELTTILTVSLPESYEPLVMGLHSRSNTIRFDMMAGRLLQESVRGHISQVSQSTTSSNHHQQTPLTVRRTSLVGSGRGSTPGQWQTYMGRGRGGYGTRSMELKSFGQTGNKVTRNQLSPNIQVPRGTKCFYCGNSGHWKRDCNKRKSDEAVGSSGTSGRQKEFTFLAKDLNTIPQKSWVIDSGASQHLCRLFISYRNVSHEQRIIIPDGTRIQTHGLREIDVPSTEGVIGLTEV